MGQQMQLQDETIRSYTIDIGPDRWVQNAMRTASIASLLDIQLSEEEIHRGLDFSKINGSWKRLLGNKNLEKLVASLMSVGKGKKEFVQYDIFIKHDDELKHLVFTGSKNLVGDTWQLTVTEDIDYYNTIQEKNEMVRGLDKTLEEIHFAYTSLYDFEELIRHDMKNPLMEIGGFAMQVSRILTEDPRLRKIVGLTKKLENVVKDLKKIHEQYEGPEEGLDVGSYIPSHGGTENIRVGILRQSDAPRLHTYIIKYDKDGKLMNATGRPTLENSLGFSISEDDIEQGLNYEHVIDRFSSMMSADASSLSEGSQMIMGGCVDKVKKEFYSYHNGAKHHLFCLLKPNLIGDGWQMVINEDEALHSIIDERNQIITDYETAIDEKMSTLQLTEKFCMETREKMKGPIDKIISLSQDILKQYRDETINAKLSIVHQEGEYMGRLLDTLSLYSGEQNVNPEYFDLNDKVRYFLAERCGRLREDPQIDIEIDCADEKLLVWLDQDCLERCLSNFVDNIVQKKKDDRVTVYFNTRRENNYAVVEVADNGDKIPDAILPDVFKERFTTKKEGTGLGLAVVLKTAAEVKGGVEWGNYDTGPYFRIKIPLESKKLTSSYK